jgi:hypothetical protein
VRFAAIASAQKQKIAASGSTCMFFAGAAGGCDLLSFI